MSDQIEEVSEPDEAQWGLWGKRDDMIVHESDPYNAEPTRAVLASGVTDHTHPGVLRPKPRPDP